MTATNWVYAVAIIGAILAGFYVGRWIITSAVRANLEHRAAQYEYLIYRAKRIGDDPARHAALASQWAAQVALQASEGGPALQWAQTYNDFFASCADDYEHAIEVMEFRLRDVRREMAQQ